VKFSPHIIRPPDGTGLELGKGFLNWVEHNVHGMLKFSVPEFSCIAAHQKKSSKFDVEKLQIFLWEWWALGTEVVFIYLLWSYSYSNLDQPRLLLL
jgi:hypothetical protein